MAAMTLEERVARDEAIRSRLDDINTEHAGDAFPDDVRSEWNDLNVEREENAKIIEELRERHARLEELRDNTDARDTSRDIRGKTINITSKRGDNEIHDLWEIRQASRSAEHEVELLRDNALRAVERASYSIPDGRNRSKGDVEAHVERLIDSDRHGEVARRVLSTGSPAYKRAFGKLIAGKPIAALSSEEQRAMSTTGSAGGYAVPFALDPTVIQISDYSVNPFRAICRNVTITGSNTWEGVTATGVTAAYQVEAGTASDNTQTFAQPTGTVQKAQAFIPYSFEIEGDFNGSMVADLTQAFSDAKDDLEASKFATGTGTAPNPVGILGASGLTTTQRYQTAGTAALVIADIDAALAQLAPRWRSRASWVAPLFFYNKVRRMYTAGGETLTAGVGPGNAAGFQTVAGTNGQGIGYTLLGKPAYENTTINSSGVLTSATKQAVLGDFSRGMVIVDRVGMNVEPVNHLFGASGYPNGSRGLLAWWRNCTVITTKTAFVYIETL